MGSNPVLEIMISIELGLGGQKKSFRVPSSFVGGEYSKLVINVWAGVWQIVDMTMQMSLKGVPSQRRRQSRCGREGRNLGGSVACYFRHLCCRSTCVFVFPDVVHEHWFDSHEAFHIRTTYTVMARGGLGWCCLSRVMCFMFVLLWFACWFGRGHPNT